MPTMRLSRLETAGRLPKRIGSTMPPWAGCGKGELDPDATNKPGRKYWGLNEATLEVRGCTKFRSPDIG